MANPDASTNVLYALLGYQTGLLDEAELLTATRTWVAAKDRPMEQVLRERGTLDRDAAGLLDTLVSGHLRLHCSDPQRSLAALTSVSPSLREVLRGIDDPDLESTLGHVETERTDRDAVRAAAGDVRAASPAPRYRVLRPYARGGLGQVSIALDEELEREVALKEIQPQHADDPLSRSRFLREARVTGTLEHPGIVPIYSLGKFADDRPFYAMRFVRGDTLREAIARFHGDKPPDGDSGARAVAFQTLLRRFLGVCDAVAYAHSRGVLHRDLKPGNILLGPFGETLVVDWGLAKVAGVPEDKGVASSLPAAWSSTSGSSETLPGTAVGSPAFMSPEQAEGADLGPASDVYSLGATLFTLLTGQLAFPDSKAVDVMRKVREGDFARPRQVDPAIPPPLEAVCLKAMARPPEQRYATPSELALEISRWLAGEPVAAYPEPWLARVRRWVGRHRTVVTAAAAAVVVAVLGLTAMAGLQAAANGKLKAANDNLRAANRRERAARDMAQARLDLALEAVAAYYTGVSEDVLLREPQFERLRTRLLEAPLEFYRKVQRLLRENADPNPRAQADLADAYFRLAAITDKIGNKDDALDAHRAALAIREQLVRTQPRSTQYLTALGSSYAALGGLERQRSRSPEALRYLEQAIEVQERLAAAEHAPAGPRHALASCLLMIGALKNDAGENRAALPYYARARAIWESLARADPASRNVQSSLAEVHNNLGNVQMASGQTNDAETSYRAAIAIAARLVDTLPSDPEAQKKVAVYSANLGVLCFKTRRLDEALGAYMKSVAAAERLVREMPTVTKYQEDLGHVYYRLGYLHRQLHHGTEAADFLTKAAEIRGRIAAANPSILSFQIQHGFSLGTLGNLQAELRRFDSAERTYLQVVALRKRLLASHPRSVEFQEALGRSYHNLGTIYLPDAKDRPDDAAHWLDQARALDSALVKAAPDDEFFRSHLAGVCHDLGVVARRRGEAKPALAWFDRAIEHQRVAVAKGDNRPRFREELGQFYAARAATLRALGRSEEASATTLESEVLAAGNPLQLYDAACQHALCISLVGHAETAPDAALRVEHERFAQRAMSALRRSIQAGYNDARQLASDPDLDPLRLRPDFRLLLLGLAFPTEAFAP